MDKVDEILMIDGDAALILKADGTLEAALTKGNEDLPLE